jgi:hypothetical protein
MFIKKIISLFVVCCMMFTCGFSTAFASYQDNEKAVEVGLTKEIAQALKGMSKGTKVRQFLRWCDITRTANIEVHVTNFKPDDRVNCYFNDKPFIIGISYNQNSGLGPIFDRYGNANNISPPPYYIPMRIKSRNNKKVIFYKNGLVLGDYEVLAKVGTREEVKSFWLNRGDRKTITFDRW